MIVLVALRSSENPQRLSVCVHVCVCVCLCVCVCVHLCMCFAHVTLTECYAYQTFITVTEMDHDNRIKVTSVMVHDKSDTAVVSITVAVIAC